MAIEAGAGVLDIHVDRAFPAFQPDLDAISGSGATLANAVGHQLGDEEDQQIQVALGKVAAPA